ncbi:glycosyltransferase family 4 protein [Psychroserpens sp. Hel_I_66]|uniref:glycosyltransferase family 4 protein n=1 Tax=Psychroserpens sp. Hel_I_66 TaxID=1250004 RepID=UPI000647B28C|nr:glycosyltransferase family 1 protein [Psychroserpens sp. Hel_I_66]
MNIKVTYFFRKPYQDYFSIENVFKIVQQALPNKIAIHNYHLKYYSTGVIKRLKSCFEVLKQLADVNHVTGDIHYVTYFMPKKNTILTIHDLAPLVNSKGVKHTLLKFFWYQLPIKSVKYVTVISNYTKLALLDIISINPEKIKVIHNPLSNELKFQPKDKVGNVPVLLQVGTSYNKNLEGLIEAIKGLKVELMVIGKLSDDQLDKLNSSSIIYKNAYNLEFEEVISLYVKSDLVCFASFYEGFGLPILEAQSIGRPVITSNKCAMPEVAGDGAVLIDPSNIKAYREAIQSILSNREQREVLIKNGLKNIERFSASKIANQYMDLYKSMVANA